GAGPGDRLGRGERRHAGTVRRGRADRGQPADQAPARDAAGALSPAPDGETHPETHGRGTLWRGILVVHRGWNPYQPPPRVRNYMTHTPTEPELPEQETPELRESQAQAQAIANDVVARVLARAGTARADGGTVHTDADGDQLDLEERSALRRVAGLSTELEDVTEVEYRQLRLEKVVLVGL